MAVSGMMTKSGSMPTLMASGTKGTLHADLSHIAFDTALTSKIMRKREQEMARRAQLLDPRKRSMGVQHHFLDEQVFEKRDNHEKRYDDDMENARDAMTQESVLQTLEAMQHQARRDKKKETVDFSLKNCHKETRREYHLSDPNSIKYDKTFDDNELLAMGCSSMQNIGLVNQLQADKKHERQMQQRAWLQEQMAVKQDKLNAEKDKDRQWDEEMLFGNTVRGIAEQQSIHEAREDKCIESETNRQMAVMHRNRRAEKHDKHIAGLEKHVEHIMNDPGLGEHHDYLIGMTGKLVRTEYRRLSQPEKQDVWNTNAMLILEKQNKKRDEQTDSTSSDTRRCLEVLQAMEEQKRQGTWNRRQEAESYNKAMAKSKHERDNAERRNLRSFSTPEL